ncbi:MAG: hypothetical protein AB7D36_05400 [Oscillospiraceae bacterium]
MTEILRQWILSLALTALGCSIALAITPEGRVRAILKLCCSVAMAIALISPVMRLNMDSYALSMAKYREIMLAAENKGAESADRLSRTIIESECAAYISDKGAELGLGEISVRVLAKWGDEVWYPYEAWVDSMPSEELMRSIEGELGIPRERTHWNDEITGTEKEH